MKTGTKVLLGVLSVGVVGVIVIIVAVAATGSAIAHDPVFQAELHKNIAQVQQQAQDIKKVESNPDTAWLLTDPAYITWITEQQKQLEAKGLSSDDVAQGLRAAGAGLWRGLARLSDHDIRVRATLECSMSAAADVNTCAAIAHANSAALSQYVALLNVELPPLKPDTSSRLVEGSVLRG